MVQAYTGFGTKRTSQREQIPGSDQIQNNAGGYSYPVDDWTRLERFLVLGSEGGTYYVNQKELTKQNALATMRCIQQDGERAVLIIRDVSVSGRAAKNDPALFALAMAISVGDANTKRRAAEVLPAVARIGTHLLHFVAYAEQFRGWGRTLRRAVADWYTSKSAEQLALQVVKYQSRDKWSHRDLLRLAHPKAEGAQNDVLHWAVKGWPGIGDEPPEEKALRLLWAFESAKLEQHANMLPLMIRAYGLPRESVPTQALNNDRVWAALLDEPMGMTAMIRNLATMTRVGLLGDFTPATGQVVSRLSDAEELRKARVHPMQILSALRTYAQGRGERSSNTWTPVRRIVDALDAAFYASFGNVQPSGKRMMIGLDVSGSMSSTMVNGMPYMSCHEAQSAMALMIASIEQEYAVCAFDTDVYPLIISPRERLDSVLAVVRSKGGGGTNCALPIMVAIQQSLPIEMFVIFTDSETWQGDIHPQQAIEQYRRESGIPAKLVVVAMAANSTSVGDSKDARVLNCVGFDTATPQLIMEFARG